jgi:Tfp pilus assembly protein PilV
MRTLRRGNEEGYSLVDAALSIFIAGVVLLAVCALVAGVMHFSRQTVEKINASIQTQNDASEKVFSYAD